MCPDERPVAAESQPQGHEPLRVAFTKTTASRKCAHDYPPWSGDGRKLPKALHGFRVGRRKIQALPGAEEFVDLPPLQTSLRSAGATVKGNKQVRRDVSEGAEISLLPSGQIRFWSCFSLRFFSSFLLFSVVLEAKRIGWRTKSPNRSFQQNQKGNIPTRRNLSGLWQDLEKIANKSEPSCGGIPSDVRAKARRPSNNTCARITSVQKLRIRRVHSRNAQ